MKKILFGLFVFVSVLGFSHNVFASTLIEGGNTVNIPSDCYGDGECNMWSVVLPETSLSNTTSCTIPTIIAHNGTSAGSTIDLVYHMNQAEAVAGDYLFYVGLGCGLYPPDYHFYFYWDGVGLIPEVEESCSDGIQNQNETDIDIGGVCHNTNVVYSQNYIGENIDIYTDNIETSFYQYYAGGATIANPPITSGFYVPKQFNKVRIKRISGRACSQFNNVGMTYVDGNSAVTFINGVSDKDYCEFSIWGGNAPSGTYGSIYFLGDQSNSILDGSSFNDGISVNGYNNNYINGGFAFQLCNNTCDKDFENKIIESCSDGIQNQDETDIDIGGICQKLTHNPVLIIPGVLGTEISKPDNIFEKLWLDIVRTIADIGDQFMDPLQFNVDLTPSDTSLVIDDVIRKKVFNIGNLIERNFDYTDGLLSEFQNQGYTEGTDIFLFPYDWRYGVNNSNIDSLKQKIEEIRVQTESDEVDIIAHSTGGLLVKKYVVDNQTDNHIGKAVFVGVPNTGAPQAVKTLLQGSNFGVPLLADEEMKKIAKNMPVIYDLLPSQKYFNDKGSYIKILNQYGSLSTFNDLDFDQVNSFLTNDHNFNNQALSNAHDLHTADFDNFDMRDSGVDVYSINGCKAGTLRGIIENRSKDTSGDIFLSYDLLEPTPGDSTVPLESSTSLPMNQSNRYYALAGNHSDMPSRDGIRQEIVNLITGSSLDIDDSLITQDISKCELDGDYLKIKSPVDIDIIDQDGNHSGLLNGAIQNDIPNASFEIMGDHKFVYLPSDEGQTYTISLKGTDTGVFTLKSENISSSEVTQTEVFSNIPVTTSLTGQVNLGDTTTLSLDNNGDGTTDQIIQPSSVVDSNQSQDLISPVSTAVINGQEGQIGFYRSDMNINISAIDPIITGQESQTSGILKINYNLDDTGYQIYSTPITVTTEGEHTLKFFSTDKSGNNEMERSISFTIDKTSPELEMMFDINSKNVIFSAQDNLDQNPTIVTTRNSSTLTDASGNITIIKYKELPIDFKFTHSKINKNKNRVIVSVPVNKYKESTTKLGFIFTKIIRNGVTTKVPNNSVSYDWKEKKGSITDLNTRITIKGMEKYLFNYKKATDITTIKVKTNSKIVTTTQSGFIVVTIKTDGDNLKVSY